METQKPGKPHSRFTFRQREFARHYAAGLPAAEAAHKSGYAASTAETNAARLLSHPLVAQYIQKRRGSLCSVTQQDVQMCVDRLRNIVKNSLDEDRVIKASRQLIRILLSQTRHGILPIDGPDSIEGSTDSSLDNPAAQPLDIQSKLKPTFSLGEIDVLPSGESAFDLRIHPKKQEHTKKLEPVIVNFVCYSEKPDLEEELHQPATPGNAVKDSAEPPGSVLQKEEKRKQRGFLRKQKRE